MRLILTPAAQGGRKAGRGTGVLARSKVAVVVVFCLLLFLGTAGLLATAQHMDPSRLHALSWYQTYARYRPLMVGPFSVFVDLALALYGIVWVFRPPKKPVSDALRMGVLAVAICIILAHVLLVLFRL